MSKSNKTTKLARNVNKLLCKHSDVLAKRRKKLAKFIKANPAALTMHNTELNDLVHQTRIYEDHVNQVLNLDESLHTKHEGAK